MTPPSVTVLTAVRNGARFLPQAISSVRAQTVTDWEYIVVDDASDDGSAELVEAAMRSDERIRLIRRATPGGPYVAANDGLAEARGRYVARLDADDVAIADRLERQLHFLEQSPKLRACGGRHRAITSSGEIFRPPRRITSLPGVLRWRLCFASDLSHSSAFLELSAFQEIGGYRPERLAQDWRMWSELSRKGWLGIVPEVVVYRRVHDARITSTEASKQDESAVDVAREHIQALSGERWSPEDVRVLRRVVHQLSSPLIDGLRLVDRWARLWRADTDLTEHERAELSRFTRNVRLRLCLRPGETLPVLGSLVRAVGQKFPMSSPD